jgi:hypothetical protein
MSIAAVVYTRNAREHPHLLRRYDAVRDRDPQHRRVALDVEAVLQTQRPELVLGQLTDEEAPRLVAKLGDALVDKALIEGVVAVHAAHVTGDV